jgi:DNA-binding SARP family transcriptional activator/predicted ATPase
VIGFALTSRNSDALPPPFVPRAAATIGKLMHLHLSTLPRIECSPEVTIPLAPRDAVVLAWLAVEGPITRARMASMLWPASSDAQARSALRQRLLRLNKSVGVDLIGNGPVLQLPDVASHDLSGLGEFLGDLRLPDAPELDTWLQAQREQHLARERDELVDQAQALEDRGDAPAALSVALTLLRRAPLSEAAHRRVMRLQYLSGDRAAALLAFDRCEAVLKDQIGATPSADTLSLLATIEVADPASRPAVYRPVPASVLRPPRMVGRNRELQQLEDAWAAGHVVAVIGEAGMGKTRLLYDFMQRNAGMVRASGRPGDAGVPFATLARLLRAVGDLSRQATGSLRPETRQEIARVLPELGGTPGHHSEGQRLRLRRAVAEFLLSSGSPGMVLDDLHFADAASLEMLQSLFDGEDAATTLRWALAFRPAEAGTPVQQLQQSLTEAAQLALVPVLPLGVSALAELVDELGLPGVAGVRLAPALLQSTGGNPLFVLEILKQAWVEQRMDALSAGRSSVRPVSVGQLIEARVLRLSPEALALARVASIAGVDFQIALAEKVLGSSAMRFADALNELEAAQVLKGTHFAHDLVFEAVLRTVPKAIAVHAHAQVAEWLETHEGEPARVAQHWIDAQQPEQALPWLAKAAARAQAALRNAEHLSFLDMQADIEESLGQREAAFERRVEALRVHTDAGRDADEAQARFVALERLADTEELRIRVWLQRASTARHRSERESTVTYSGQALSAAQALGRSDLIQRAQLSLFASLTAADRHQEALAMGEACLGWIDAETDEARMNFHGALATLYDNRGQPSKCLAQNELARKHAERCGHVMNLVAIANNLATCHIYVGRMRQAVASSLDALRALSQLEAPSAHAAMASLYLSAAYGRLGHFAEALRWANEAEHVFSTSAPLGVLFCDSSRSTLYWDLGQRARSTQIVERIAASPELPRSLLVRQLLLRCRMSREQGRPTQDHVDAGLTSLQAERFGNLRELLLIERALALPAPDALVALAQIGDRSQMDGYHGALLETQMRAAQIALALDPALARQHALQALETSRDYDLVTSYPGELWLHAATALLTAGDFAAGLEVLRRSVDWLHGTARDHVPAEFRDSFLHRNPTNVAITALAAKHGALQPMVPFAPQAARP